MRRLEELTDEALLAAYADEGHPAGEREAAFLALVERFERRVYAICYRQLGNHADAEDATQDVFLSIARRAGQFQGGSKLSTWIYRIAVNACHDIGRRYARRPQTPVEDIGETLAEAGGEAEVDDAIAGLELAHEIERALLQLDELSRTLIVLCSIEGQSYADVSAMLDLPVGTIKSRVFRARAKLAELLAPVTEPDDQQPRLLDDTPVVGEVPPSRSSRGPPG